jgi:glycosyltransferase involved in cell wall biosynthesis
MNRRMRSPAELFPLSRPAPAGAQAASPAAAAAERFSVCIIIPFFDHPGAIEATVAAVARHGLPCLLIDDGSADGCRPLLQALARRESAWLQLVRLETNQGKGAGVMRGFELAAAAGHSHGLQVDADGQHDYADIPRLVEQARLHPQALVTGIPRYDGSVPGLRFYGRYLTHVLVWLETISLEIRDSMCGYRVYPLAPALASCRTHRIGRRMDFDTEIIVRMFWSGVRVICLPTRVTYPSDGVSHFRYVRDNARMLGLHLRLLAGMLPRLPLLLWRSLRR